MKNKKIIKKSIAILLLTAMLISVFSINNVQEVQAENRLQGIQKIVSNLSEENKYTILEIVPDKAFASMGYYVSGYEAEIDTKIIAALLQTNTIEEITDTAKEGYVERKNAVENYFKLLQGNVIEFDSDSIYQESIEYQEAVSNWASISAGEGKTFKDIRKGNYIEVNLDEGMVGDYSLVDEKYVYMPGRGNYIWADNSESGTLQIVEFSTLYYKTDVTSNDWLAKRVLEIGAAVGTETPGPVTNHNVEVISVTPNELEERLNVTSEGALQLEDVDMIYLSNSSCLALPTITYNSYDSNTIYTQTQQKKNDVSWETAYNIFDYVVNTNLPIIVDDSIIPAVTNENASLMISANNNIIRLAYMLKNYTESYPNDLKYTIDQYKLTADASYVIPSVLPGETVAEGEETREEADAKIGTALVSAYASYVGFEGKLAGKTAAVYASVFVNKSGKNIVHSAFSTDKETIIVDSTTTSKVYGVASVVDEIHSENFHYHLESQEFTTEYVYDETNPAVIVNQPTLIKYILNFNNRRIELYKDKITVLDIEPTKYSTLTESKVRDWLTGTEASQKIKEIEIVQTSTKEFIGKLDDLNKEYDLIYIGSCIGNTSLQGSINQTSGGVTNYNDAALDGLIYTRVGDLVDMTNRAGGLLVDEYKTTSMTELKDSQDRITTRYSGNDITETKVEQLKEFVNSGYPVVISNTFYNGSAIRKDRVDENSYMYEFMSSCANEPNVLKESEGLASVLPDYINMPKLNLSIISQPAEYAITETNGSISAVTYLEKLGNRNVLIYSFEFSNTSEGNLNANDYQVQLYVDINADGQFDNTEELDSLEVLKTATLEVVNYDQLKANVRYTVSRELPEDYVGIIPWQLKVSKVEYSTQNPTQRVESRVRTTAEGFTAIKAEQKTEVKVLQIASLQMNNGNKYTGLILPYANLLNDPNNSANNISSSKIETTKFNSLFADIETHMGFDINVDVISVNAYVSRYTAAAQKYVSDNLNTYKQEYLKENPNANSTTVTQEATKRAQAAAIENFYKTFYADYDMIIMGFEDCYQDIDDAGAVQAIDMFIKSGRSVLFAHDTTSYFNVDRTIYDASKETSGANNPWYHWGYHLNKYIRSDVGMDRYGVTEDSLAVLKQANDLSGTNLSSHVQNATSLNKEVAYYTKSGDTAGVSKDYATHEVHGFADGLIDIYREGSKHASYVYGSADFVENSQNSGSSYYSKSITQVNKGQITTYPYNINLEAESTRSDVTGTSFKQMDLPTMSIAKTHAQYYQLDMNIDKDLDGSADMTVWYCLSNNRNKAFPNDVRNSYYIYSVGNVTYTGMGHYQNSTTASGLSEAEAKLFVNTIMASLNSGKKNPGVNIIADNTNKNSSLSYVYRTYDNDVVVDDASNVALNFYATDMNIVNGTKTIYSKYYFEIPAGEYKTGTTDIEVSNADGTKKYLRVIPADKITAVDTVGNGIIAQASIDGQWINAQMQDSTKVAQPFTVYISAQTKMNSSQNANEVEWTGEVFDSVTFKQRNLFELD